MSGMPSNATRKPQRGDTGYYVRVDEFGEPRLVSVTYRLSPEPGWYDLSIPADVAEPLQPGEWFDPANVVLIIRAGGSMIR